MHALRRVRLALSFPRPCASSRSPGGSASLEKYRLLNGTFARGCDFLCFFFFFTQHHSFSKSFGIWVTADSGDPSQHPGMGRARSGAHSALRGLEAYATRGRARTGGFTGTG